MIFLFIYRHSLQLYLFSTMKTFLLPQGDASWTSIIQDGDTILEDERSHNLYIMYLCH